MAYRLTRFSGSTLEPCSEPVVLYPSEVNPMAKRAPMILNRFSGSTLEPCAGPIVMNSKLSLHSQSLLQVPRSTTIKPSSTKSKSSPPNIEFSSEAALSVRIIPTRPTKPLRRNAKPSSIHIPNLSQIASMNAADRLLDEGHASGGGWSDDEADEPWLMWDEKTQTIYRPEKRHAFWDTPPPRRPSAYCAYSPTPSFSSASSTSSTD
ncbi:hypothetical protein F4703DRAFT_1882709 [Phycomyces blakesleeanus]